MNRDFYPNFCGLICRRANVEAIIIGAPDHSEIRGRVSFYQTAYGVVVVSEIRGLPINDNLCSGNIFALHIHEGGACSGNADDPFADVGSHYNPNGCEHPYHSGDLPPLFGADGYAFAVCLTNRFTLAEIIGKTIIIHAMSDDFTTQPSGNAGSKIACGEILSV